MPRSIAMRDQMRLVCLNVEQTRSLSKPFNRQNECVLRAFGGHALRASGSLSHGGDVEVITLAT